MKRENLEKYMNENCKNSSANIVDEKTQSKFSDYFATTPQGLAVDKIISDESLFRDYSRLGERKVDFERIRNPFNLSKYTISSYDKTWFIFKEGKPEGPYNSYEMDNFYKKGLIKKNTNLGINETEFFRFDYFIEIVYPLPRIKASAMTQSRIKRVQFMPNIAQSQ